MTSAAESTQIPYMCVVREKRSALCMHMLFSAGRKHSVENVDHEISTSICKHLAIDTRVKFLDVEGFKYFCVKFRSALFHDFEIVYGQLGLLAFYT